MVLKMYFPVTWMLYQEIHLFFRKTLLCQDQVLIHQPQTSITSLPSTIEHLAQSNQTDNNTIISTILELMPLIFTTEKHICLVYFYTCDTEYLALCGNLLLGRKYLWSGDNL